MPCPFPVRPTAACLPALATALCVLLALPASAAEFITSSRSLSGSYSGQSMLVGIDASSVRVPNVQVDILAPAQLNFSDSTGGFMAAYSNSLVRVQGGSFGPASSFPSVGRLTLNDTSRADISGGLVNGLTLNGTAAGAAGARATVSGGTVQNLPGVAALIQNGTLDVSGGTIQATGNNGQMAIYGLAGSVITVSGGTVRSASAAAIDITGNSALTMIGGAVIGGPAGGGQWGVRLGNNSVKAVLSGGTVDGGVRADAALNQTATQATLGGGVKVNGGVFAYGNAALDVTGGSFTRFAGANASFFAMGTNSLNFFGDGLVLSGATAGSVFETNTYAGNFYTFTAGTLADGQSAVGLRLFDAVSVAGNPLGGGFTLNQVSAVPEPSTWLLLLLALPAVATVARRRSQTLTSH